MPAEARRVLIADADEALRQQLYTLLLDLDIFSDCVSTTADAKLRLAAERYGVVVLDVALPGSDIVEVITSISQMAPANRPVVLILAGNPERARSLDVEIVQIVLRKPVRLSQLTDVVRSCILNVGARSATVLPPAREPNNQTMS